MHTPSYTLSPSGYKTLTTDPAQYTLLATHSVLATHSKPYTVHTHNLTQYTLSRSYTLTTVHSTHSVVAIHSQPCTVHTQS